MPLLLLLRPTQVHVLPLAHLIAKSLSAPEFIMDWEANYLSRKVVGKIIISANQAFSHEFILILYDLFDE